MTEDTKELITEARRLIDQAPEANASGWFRKFCDAIEQAEARADAVDRERDEARAKLGLAQSIALPDPVVEVAPENQVTIDKAPDEIGGGAE